MCETLNSQIKRRARVVGLLPSYTYTVNPLGQRTGLTTAFDLGVGLSANPGDTAWGYDGLGQLTRADSSVPTRVGNRWIAARLAMGHPCTVSRMLGACKSGKEIASIRNALAKELDQSGKAAKK